MFLPVEVSDLHEKPGVAAIETFFKLLIQSPGLRSIQENRLNTCLEKPNFTDAQRCLRSKLSEV